MGVPIRRHPEPLTGVEGATRHTPRRRGGAQQATDLHHGAAVTTAPPPLGGMAPPPRLHGEAKKSRQFGGSSGEASKLRQEKNQSKAMKL